MIFKIFATLLAAVLGFLGLQQPSTSSAPPTVTTSTSAVATSEPTSTSTQVSTSVPTTAPVVAVPEFGMTIIPALPADAHPGTDADMQKFVTSLWVSPNSTDAKIDFSQSKLYKDYPPIDFLRDFGPRTAKQLKDTTVPDNTRSYVGGTMCPKLRGLAWFEGNRIHTMSWWKTYPTKGCGMVPQIEDTEFQNFLKNATLYFNAAGDRVYVERHTDGAISEWKLHS